MNNEEKRREYGRLAKARAEKVYCCEKIASQYEECFNAIESSRRRFRRGTVKGIPRENLRLSPPQVGRGA